MNFIVIIPARGGSKRLSGKNIKLFAGKPLIAYSIEIAFAIKNVSRVIVTTDNLEIAAISKRYNAEVFDRPVELATDTSSTNEAIQNVVNQIPEIDAYTGVVTLQPTNPLRPLDIMNQAFEEFIEMAPGFTSLITVTKNERKLGKIQNKTFEPVTYTPGQRTQDLSPLYFENGLLYITRPSAILKGQIFGEKIYPFVVDGVYTECDIDDQKDFDYAEFVYKQHQELFEIATK